MSVSVHVKKNINELKEADLRTASYGNIKRSLESLGQNLVFGIELPESGFILRNRSEITFEAFKYEHEISYRKDNQNVSMGRANIPGCSVFYGGLPANGNENICQANCYFESSKIMMICPVVFAGVFVGLGLSFLQEFEINRQEISAITVREEMFFSYI